MLFNNNRILYSANVGRLDVITRTRLRYVRVFAVPIPSVVCLSVTLVHPTQESEPFGNISSSLCTLAILCKFDGDRPRGRGTRPPGALNARGYYKSSSGDDIPERDVTYHLICLLIHH